MYLNWKERLAQLPELRNFLHWPEIMVSDLPKRKRACYLINCRIVTQALDQQSFEIIARNLGISKSKISKLMSRCLAGDDKEAPPLTTALIPNTHIVSAERRSNLSTFKNTRGATGSFKWLLNKLPQLREHLHLILTLHIKDKSYSQHIKPKFFFAAFTQFLREHQWPTDQYPYTEKSMGYESLRQYMNEQLTEMTLQRIANQNPKPRIRVANITKSIFAEVQIDEHTYDTNCAIHLEFEGKLKPLRVSRVSLIVAVDVASQAILSYVIVLNKTPDQNDVLDCLTGIYRKWSPQTLTCPGLHYGPNDGFPCGNLFDEDNAPSLGELRLDNAMTHVATSIRCYVTDVLFSTYNLGIPATPKVRNWVEYAFKLVTDDSHRFRSTTGSHVQDPCKESKKNSVNPPVISLQALEETIEVILAHQNGRRRANLGGSSPLEILEYQLNQKYIPRLTRGQFNASMSPIDIKVVTVLFCAKDKRVPHINFADVRYVGTCLNNPDLINQKVEIHINKKDARKLSVFKDGNFLGEIFAPKSWQRFAHSLRTRKYIFDLIKNRSINGDIDPLVNYFNYLLEHRHLPEIALELVRVHREFTVGKAGQFVPNEVQQNENMQDIDTQEDALKENKFPSWSPSLSGI